jgi:hypothetical protein
VANINQLTSLIGDKYVLSNKEFAAMYPFCTWVPNARTSEMLESVQVSM